MPLPNRFFEPRADSTDFAHQAPASADEITSSIGYRTAAAAAAMGILLGVTLMVWTWVRAASMSADGAHYMELAKQSWRHGPMAGMNWYAGPGYPFVVGWMYGLLGNLDLAGRLTSFLFGLATLLGVGVLSYQLFGRMVACLSVGLLAVHTTFVRHSVMAETDAAYGCWLVWSLWFVWQLAHASTFRGRAIWSSLAGVTLGLGYLTRPEAVPLAGLLGLWYMSVNFANAARPRAAEFIHRIGITVWVVTLFFVVATPYLLKLRSDLGRWSLSGKERSIVLKFVPDKRNYEEVLKLGITGALLHKPSNVIHWLPYHVHWGVPQFGKSLHLEVLILAAVGFALRGRVQRSPRAVGFLIWVTVPFILFFFLTFPGRRYFMQAMPAWTILAAVGSVELAYRIARWRVQVPFVWDRCSLFAFAQSVESGQSALNHASQRALRISLVTPVLLMAATTVWSNRHPIEQSLSTERAIGERILEIGGAGRRILSFTVTAFYAQAERVPLWGPMEGIVRCHGYGQPLSYDEFKAYVERHGVEYVVLDHDIRADCPEFLDRVQSEDFELVANDIVDHHGTHLVYRHVGARRESGGANQRAN